MYIYISSFAMNKKKIMKIISTILFMAGMVVLSSCGSGSQSKSTEETNVSADGVEMSYSVDPAASEVSWRGEVAGVYGHDGVIAISEGTVSTKGKSLTGGKVVIDMTTIEPSNPEEYADEDGKRASDLKGHLSTGDFFEVEEFPTATFVIKSHVGNKVIGDLTIRGITQEEEATISSIEITETGLSAKGDLVFNRQDYGVSWVHYMKDMVLSDDIKIGLSITAKS